LYNIWLTVGSSRHTQTHAIWILSNTTSTNAQMQAWKGSIRQIAVPIYISKLCRLSSVYFLVIKRRQTNLKSSFSRRCMPNDLEQGCQPPGPATPTHISTLLIDFWVRSRRWRAPPLSGSLLSNYMTKTKYYLVQGIFSLCFKLTNSLLLLTNCFLPSHSILFRDDPQTPSEKKDTVDLLLVNFWPCK